MKLLFDQHLSFRLCSLIADVLPDCNQVRLIGLDKASDQEIWQYAKEHGFTIVTQDGDFSEMSALYGSPPKVIWLRCGNQPTSKVEQLIRGHIVSISAFESNSAVSCLEIL